MPSTSGRSSEYTFSVAPRALASGLEGGADDDEEGTPFGRPVPEHLRVEDVHRRVLGLLWRLMLGVSLEMSDPSRVRAPSKAQRGALDPRGVAAPEALTYVLHC